MDFRSMKRKELQALCKKHKIPANLSNLEMANRLAELFEEKGTSVVQGLVKEQDGNGGEIESANVVMDGKGKKVRFSPEHELFEFTRSQAVKRRSRRVSVLGKNSLPVENVDNGEMNNENVGNPGRAMRSRGSELIQEEVNENKRGRRGVKINDSKNNAAAVESDNGELREGTVDNPDRVLRSRGSELMQEEVNEKTRGRRGVKINGSKNNAASVESDNGELRVGVDNPGRVLRSRGKVQNATSTKGRKRAKINNSGDEKALYNADDDKLIEEKVDSPIRVTRFGGQQLKEASAKKEKIGRKVVKSNDDVGLVSAETDDSTVVVTEGKLAEGMDERKKGNRKGMKEDLGNKKTAEEHVMVEPQIFLRKSPRNGNKVDVSELTNDDISKHVKGANKGLRRAPKLLEAEGSGEVVESTESKADLDGRVVIPIEKPVVLEQRRSNRRKSVISSHERGGNDETKASVLQLNADGVTKDDKKDVQHVGVTRMTRRKTMSLKPVGNHGKLDVDASVPQLSTAGEVSKDEKKVSQPTGVTRRSKRKTSLTLVSTDENSDNVAAVENFEADEQMSKPCLVKEESAAGPVNTRRTRRNASTYTSLETITEFGVDPIIEQKNEARKRRRGPVSGRNVDDTNNDSSSLTHSTRKESRSKIKAETAAAIGELADKRKTPSKWEESIMSDASSNGGLEVGESLFVNFQLSVVEGTESANNVGLSSDRIAKKINKDDVGLTPGNVDSELIDGNELPNPLEKAESISEKLNNDCADSGEQTSPSKLTDVREVHSSLEYGVQEIIGQSINDMDKKNPEAQLLIKNVDSSYDDSTDNQAILDDSLVSRDAGFAEVNTSGDDGRLPGDRTDFKADADASKDEPSLSQPSLNVVDRVDELKGVPVRENLESVESREDGDISPSVVCHRSDMGQMESLNNSENSIKYTAPKSGETGVFEPCEKHTDCTDAKSELELKEPSPCMLVRIPEGGNTVEADEFFSPKDIDPNADENDEGGRLKDRQTESNKDSEFGLQGLFDGERSAWTSLQDRENFPGENLVMNSGMYNDSPTANPITIEANRTETDKDGSSKDDERKCDEVGEFTTSTLLDPERVDMITPQDREIFSCENPIKNFDEEGVNDFPSITPTTTGNFSEIKVSSDHKADCITEEGETYVNKDVQSALAEADEGGLKVSKSTKDEDPLCSISNLFDAEGSGRTTSQDSGSLWTEHFLEDSNKQGKFHDSPVDATIRANCSEVKISACSSSLQEISSSELNTNSKLQGSVPIKMCEIIDSEAGAADTIREKEAASFHSSIFGTCASVDKITTHAEHQIFNQADEHTNQDATESAEKPESPFAGTTGIANTIELQEAWTSGSDIAPMSVFKTSEKEKTSVAVESSISNEDDKDKEGIADEYASDLAAAMNHTVSDIGVESLGDLKCQDIDENEHQCTNSPAAHAVSDVGEKPTDVDSSESCDKDKEGVADEYAADLAAAMNHTVSDVGVENLGELKCQDIDETEHQCTNSPAAHVVSDVGEKPTDVDSSESWTEIELNNLFETPGGTPTGPNNSSAQGTEIANMTMSMNKSTPKSRSCLTKKNMEEEEERESKSEKNTNEKVHLSETGSNVIWEENHLKLLFATPMKIVNPCEAKETSVHDRKLDGVAISLKECVGTVEENVAIQIKFDEKLHEVGSVELVNARTSTSFSEAENNENDDSEACEEQLAESPRESMKETNYISEDNEQVKGAIDNGNKRTEENTINLPGSPRNLDKIEGCHDISVAADLLENLGSGSRFSPISEGGMAQTSEAAFELSDADFQKSKNPENIQSFISSDEDDNNNMKESSNDKQGSRLDLEVADIGGFNGEKDAINEEQGSPADRAESDILSSLATILRDDGNGGTEKSEAGTEVLNMEPDHEKNGKEVIPELNLQEKIVDFKNDNISVLNASASACDEPLKESDVADTIQEYIDSESSLSVDVEDSETTLQIDASTHTDEKSTYENAVACDPAEDIDGRIVNKPLIESFEEENKELEDKTLFMEPAPESEKPVDGSPVCINFFDQGSPANKPSVETKVEELEEILSSGSASADVNNTLSVSEKESNETSSKLLFSTAKKNARAILIHGTPGKKLLTTADMKENVPMHKSSNMGDFTTARPRKRKALQDVQWK